MNKLKWHSPEPHNRRNLALCGTANPLLTADPLRITCRRCRAPYHKQHPKSQMKIAQ